MQKTLYRKPMIYRKKPLPRYPIRGKYPTGLYSYKPTWLSNRGNNAWIPPQYKLRPQTLGAGSTVRWIEYDYTLAASASTVMLSMTTFLNNQGDFARLAASYRFFKIIKLTMTVYPQAQSSRIKALLKWTDDSGLTNIDINDSTKIIQTHMLANKYAKWRMPNAMLPINRGNNPFNVFNYDQWTVCDDIINGDNYTIPGALLLKREGDLTAATYLRFSLQVLFRGADPPDPAKLIKLAAKLQKMNNDEQGDGELSEINQPNDDVKLENSNSFVMESHV